jgi:hypothetical protein
MPAARTITFALRFAPTTLALRSSNDSTHPSSSCADAAAQESDCLLGAAVGMWQRFVAPHVTAGSCSRLRCCIVDACSTAANSPQQQQSCSHSVAEPQMCICQKVPFCYSRWCVVRLGNIQNDAFFHECFAHHLRFSIIIPFLLRYHKCLQLRLERVVELRVGQQAQSISSVASAFMVVLAASAHVIRVLVDLNVSCGVVCEA